MFIEFITTDEENLSTTVSVPISSIKYIARHTKNNSIIELNHGDYIISTESYASIMGRYNSFSKYSAVIYAFEEEKANE